VANKKIVFFLSLLGGQVILSIRDGKWGIPEDRGPQSVSFYICDEVQTITVENYTSIYSGRKIEKIQFSC
jgi:hypothetical protein